MYPCDDWLAVHCPSYNIMICHKQTFGSSSDENTYSLYKHISLCDFLLCSLNICADQVLVIVALK